MCMPMTRMKTQGLGLRTHLVHGVAQELLKHLLVQLLPLINCCVRLQKNVQRVHLQHNAFLAYLLPKQLFLAHTSLAHRTADSSEPQSGASATAALQSRATPSLGRLHLLARHLFVRAHRANVDSIEWLAWLALLTCWSKM